MTDIVDQQTRSRMMAAVRASNTGPEVALRRAVWALGVRGYRLYRKDIPGSPDMAWISRRVAVFVDGAFWHGHPSAFRRGKSGLFWDRKIAGNIQRDRKVNRALARDRWVVIRFWDFEVEKSPAECALKILQTIRQCP